MVATFHAISASTASGAAYDGSYYTAQTSEAYYSDGGERPGKWLGSGARALGLDDRVDAQEFKRVLQGLHPNTQKPLGQLGKWNASSTETQQGRKRCAAVDITLSVPSSVSALRATCGIALRRSIDKAIERAVASTIETIEQSLPLARRGRGGTLQQHAKLVVAAFRHTTNRNLDPNFHWHCVIANRAQRPDGTWGAVNTKMLADWTRTIGPLFRAKLAHELRTRLDLPLVQPANADGEKQPWFEVAGVPKELCEKWSSRRHEINRALGKLGLSQGASAQARAKANLATRSEKQRTPPEKDLRESWRHQAAVYDFEPTRDINRARQNHTATEISYDQARTEAVRRITNEHSHFSYRDLVQAVAEQLQATGAEPAELLEKVADDLANSRDFILLDPRPGKQRYTTREMWLIEKKMLDHCAHLQAAPGATVHPMLTNELLAKHPTLSDEQAGAIGHLLGQKGSLRLLTGVAGAGKSYALNIVRDALQRSGYRVLGGALSGAAKEELISKANIESRTIASFLYQLGKTKGQRVKDRLRHDARQLLRAIQKKPTYRHEQVKLDANTVLILDEAGMIDTRTMVRLLEEARKANATVILTGDENQLQPILAGGPLRHIKDRYTHYHMEQNRRQQNPADRMAASQLRDGEGESALEHYRSPQRLFVAKDRSAALDQLVDHWATHGGLANPKDHMILTMTREEARTLNRICQTRRQALRRRPDSLYVEANNERFHRGDRVLFHVPLRKLGIENGYRATVVRVHPVRRAITVRLDHEASSQNRGKPRQKLVTVPLKELPEGAVTLGYAATTHKMQGQTCQQAYVLLGGAMAHRELAYVQLTRAREATYLFTDEHHAGHELEDIKRTIGRSRAKTLAHDVAADGKLLEIALEIEHDGS